MSSIATSPARSSAAKAPRLGVEIDAAGYGQRRVIENVRFEVASGEICTILGRNGAGKSTVLRTIAGIVGAATSTSRIDGRPLTGAPYRRARAGLTTVLKGRSLFPSLTVAENLDLGGVEVDEAVELFDELGKRLRIRAGLLSGGEQQMLAVARGLLRRPKVLLIDELTIGLSPAVADRLLEQLVRKVAELEIAAVVVEQHIHFAQALASEALIMGEGRVRITLSADELEQREDEIERVYLGRPEADPRDPS